MARTNINAIFRMVKSYLDGKIAFWELELDLPYEFEQRWQGMRKEDPEWADLLYDYFLERGIEEARNMSDDQQRRELFWELYDDAKTGVW